MQNYIISDAAQGTEEWLKCRAGRITGTRLKSVMSTRKSTRLTLIHELIAEKLAPLPEVYQSGWMERGHRIEEVVKKLYPEQVESVGFIARTDIPWIGISPDGIIRDDDGKITQAVEVKAPSPKVFVQYFLADAIPDEYFWQVVHYFIVLEDLQRLDFIIYNPDFYSDTIRMKKWTVSRHELQEKIDEAKMVLGEFSAEWQIEIEKFKKLAEKNA